MHKRTVFETTSATERPAHNRRLAPAAPERASDDGDRSRPTGRSVRRESEGPWQDSPERTVIWATSDGVACVVAGYDETRYQLRLIRPGGTIKADLFANLAEANDAAARWRADINKDRP
jgi:hypothetical protein